MKFLCEKLSSARQNNNNTNQRGIIGGIKINLAAIDEYVL
jgi:hypothetical protein